MKDSPKATVVLCPKWKPERSGPNDFPVWRNYALREDKYYLWSLAITEACPHPIFTSAGLANVWPHWWAVN